MSRINKHGLSTVFSVVLVMLVSMTLAVTSGTILVKTIGLSLSPALSCTQMQINTPLTLEDACYDSQNKEIRATISRKFDSQDITSFSLSLASSSSLKWSCSETCGSCAMLNFGERKIYSAKVNTFDSTQDNTLSLSSQSCTLSSVKVELCP